MPQSSKTTHNSKMYSFWQTKTGTVSQKRSSESSKASEAHNISWAASLNLKTRSVLWKTLSLKSQWQRQWAMMKTMMTHQLIRWVLEEESQRSRVSWICLMVRDLTWSRCVDHQPQMSQRLYSERRASAKVYNSINSYASQHKIWYSNLKCFLIPTPLWRKIRNKNKKECSCCQRAH